MLLHKTSEFRRMCGQRCIVTLAVLLFCSLATCRGRLQAQDPTLGPVWSPSGDDFRSQVGSWLGDSDSAVHIAPIYYGDVFTNTRGGISDRNATRYLGLLDIGVTIDFDRAEWPIPGRLHLLAQTTHGQGLTDEFVGDSLVLSDIDPSRNITQLGGFWWEFGLCDDDVTLRVGKQDVNTEFAYMATAEHFVQSSFELTPNSALPTYPQQSMALVSLIQITPSIQLKLGAWDGLADPGTWGLSGNDTVFLVGELEYQYTLGEGLLPGTFAVGGGYLSAGEFTGQPVDASHGYLLQWEQMLFREAMGDPEDLQGLAMFAAYYPRFFGTDRLDEAIGDSAAGGLVYTGLIPGRDHDVIGAGVSWAELFQGGSNQETAIEVFYRAQVSTRVSVQPDLQYIVTPSGIHPDALVVGLRFQLEL